MLTVDMMRSIPTLTLTHCVLCCLPLSHTHSLAITEPYAGSDVANLRCTAKKTADGKHFIVNGEKKWITNGVWVTM